MYILYVKNNYFRRVNIINIWYKQNIRILWYRYKYVWQLFSILCVCISIILCTSKLNISTKMLFINVHFRKKVLEYFIYLITYNYSLTTYFNCASLLSLTWYNWLITNFWCIFMQKYIPSSNIIFEYNSVLNMLCVFVRFAHLMLSHFSCVYLYICI